MTDEEREKDLRRRFIQHRSTTTYGDDRFLLILLDKERAASTILRAVLELCMSQRDYWMNATIDDPGIVTYETAPKADAEILAILQEQR